MATYSAVRLTTTAVTGVSATAAGVTTVTIEPTATNFDLDRIQVDDTNDILTGYAGSTKYVFEQGATFTISIQA